MILILVVSNFVSNLVMILVFISFGEKLFLNITWYVFYRKVRWYDELRYVSLGFIILLLDAPSEAIMCSFGNLNAFDFSSKHEAFSVDEVLEYDCEYWIPIVFVHFWLFDITLSPSKYEAFSEDEVLNNGRMGNFIDIIIFLYLNLLVWTIRKIWLKNCIYHLIEGYEHRIIIVGCLHLIIIIFVL